jgi:hypothetical protein
MGSAPKDAMLEAAFGDPNADQAFLGSSLSARYLMGEATGGLLGNAMRYSNPADLARMTPLPVSTGGIIGMTSAGVAGGAFAGAKLSGRAGGGVRGKILSSVAGAAIGGGLGLGASMSGPVAHVAANRDFYSRSPYGNQSSATAAALNASGNIVLGMHNSRNGY